MFKKVPNNEIRTFNPSTDEIFTVKNWIVCFTMASENNHNAVRFENFECQFGFLTQRGPVTATHRGDHYNFHG